ncbi:MAG: hypothetical protein CL483_03600 [Acidobacteria bacterium]|nr:hypothetical protein [Acidobacteriota bacterium]
MVAVGDLSVGGAELRVQSDQAADVAGLGWESAGGKVTDTGPQAQLSASVSQGQEQPKRVARWFSDMSWGPTGRD